MKLLKKKLRKTLTEIINELRRHAKNKLFNFVILNSLVILFQFLYIAFREKFLNLEIPLWYTRPWGDYQLASKEYIRVFPATSIFIVFCSVILVALLNKYFVRYVTEVITTTVTFCTLLLTYQMLRVFSIATVPFTPFINPTYISLLPYFLFAVVVSNSFLPGFINWMKDLGIITIPGVHPHPSMVLKAPSVRGGGVYFTILFLILSVLMVGFIPNFSGVYLAIVLLGVLSFIDDYQNTHPNSSFKLVENPLLRLILLTSVASIPVMSGIKFDVIINPLQNLFSGQFLYLSNTGIISGIITVVWLVWFLNVLSWSNGVDGQFSGIVGIAFILIALLSLRFKELDIVHRKLAILATIGAGISFGTVGQMWHPSKIMWGFGAMSAGLILAVLSFLTQSKIITSILIILIPFLDALVTLLRRIFQGKNPLRGDRGHLHHLLLDRGWSVSKIALFYWFTTAVFGAIGLLTVERFTIQVGLIIGGVVAFFIILLNFKSSKIKNENTIPRR